MPIPTLDDRLRPRSRPPGPPAMYQSWRELLFVHWRVEPKRIQRTLPPGLQVDMFDGAAYVGVVPFYMHNIRPRGFPAIPWVSFFLELNVRTYVHDERGRAGVWFYSLDCNQPIAVWAARTFFHLPYRHARMTATSRDEAIDYRSQVNSSRRTCELSYSVAADGRPTEPGTFEFFLVERYLLFAADKRSRLFTGQVHHAPYEVAPATLPKWSSNLLAEHDFGVDESRPDHVCGAKAVDVDVFGLVRSAT